MQGFRIRRRRCAYAADKVVNADDIALRAAAMRELRRIPCFGIAALRTGTVHIREVIGAANRAWRCHAWRPVRRPAAAWSAAA